MQLWEEGWLLPLNLKIHSDTNPSFNLTSQIARSGAVKAVHKNVYVSAESSKLQAVSVRSLVAMHLKVHHAYVNRRRTGRGDRSCLMVLSAR